MYVDGSLQVQLYASQEDLDRWNPENRGLEFPVGQTVAGAPNGY